MNREHWLRAKELLADLSAVPVDEQAAWMTRACGGDAGLRAELERLLALDAEASMYFAELGGTLTPDDTAPSQIGVYHVVGEIGRGGMGTVYLGQRNDGQFEQTVAIKVVNDSLGDGMLARFRDERRILAQLKHPGIAYLLDGGNLEDGRPYFVMEYIQGKQITAHADHKRLDIEARLGLFRDVCAAVAHAHRNLVIHRDLKPGNVMVQEDDEGHSPIKLLDFGIARIIRGGHDDHPAEPARHAAGDPLAAPRTSSAMTERSPTEYSERILTPRYAAPEQIRGEAATTSSDVYALGLLLHELLTGTHPFGAGVSTPRDMQLAILAGTSSLPSLTAGQCEPSVARLRGSTPRQLARQLRGDLDSIVLKAIHKDPEQRYASAGQLADDVRRHLDGDVVTARHATATYHAGVFLRRHRFGAAVTLLALGASVALASFHLSSITHERDLARTEAAKARQVSGLLVTMLESADPQQARGKEISVREVLDKASTRITEELADQPDVRARMDSIIGTVYTSLGEYDQGETFLTRALDLQRSRHGPDYPEALETMQAMATLALRRGENQKAETLLREVLARRMQQPRHDPMLIASTQNDLAGALRRLGKPDEAETLQRAALATVTETPGADPEALMSARGNFAVMLVRQGKFEEAEKLYRQVLAQRRELQGPVHPSLANSLHNLGVLMSKQHRYPEAEQLLRESLAMSRKLYDDKHPTIATAMDQLASVLTKQERYKEAEPLLLQALALRRASLKPEHPYIALSLNSLGNLYSEQHDFARAEPLFQKAIAIARKSMGPEHSYTVAMLNNLGRMYLLSHEADKAEDTLREILHLRQKTLPEGHWQVAESQSLLGAALVQQGKLDAAEPLLNAGYTGLKDARGEDDPNTRNAKARLVKLRETRDETA